MNWNYLNYEFGGDYIIIITYRGAFNNYVDKTRGGGGSKMSVFVHAYGKKTVQKGAGGQKMAKFGPRSC